MTSLKENSDQMYLQLSPNPIRFEPVSRITNVFFDGTTKEVVSVRGGGTLGVVVHGLHSKETFCMEDRGSITSLKFAPDHSRLAVQRMPNSLELLSFKVGEVGPGVVVECKTKGATLLGFVWADPDDLVLITSHGVEFYHVSRERVFVRLSRSYSLSHCRWFVWSAECRTLMVAAAGGTGEPGQVPLYPFQFAANYYNKMPKCIVDLNHPSCRVISSARVDASSTLTSSVSIPTLSERDVCVSFVYRPVVLVLRHGHVAMHPAHLMVYTNQKDSTSFKLTHLCMLGLSGSFAVNVIDSLIIVHHQASKMSLLFDIALGTEIRDGVCCVYPATRPASIRPHFLEEPSVTATSSSRPASTSSSSSTISSSVRTASGSPASLSGSTVVVQDVARVTGFATQQPYAASAAVSRIPCQLYALTWVVFQPSVIIDARLGCLWTLQLDLPALAATFTDSVQLISCLLNRRHAKPLVLHSLRRIVEHESLHSLGPVFERINAGYRRHLDGVAGAGLGTALTPPTSTLLQPLAASCNVFASLTPAVVVEAVDVYSSVLNPMMEDAQNLGKKNPVGEEHFKDVASEEGGMKREVVGSDDAVDTSKDVVDMGLEKLLVSTKKPCEPISKSEDDSEVNEDMNEAARSLVSVIIMYLRSVSAAGLPAPYFLHTLLVNALLLSRSYFHLHQLLQYHLIPDSKPLACVLLSRAGVYPAFLQLSLDMLWRLRTAHEEVLEVLLDSGHITGAIRYSRAHAIQSSLPPRKVLEAALKTGSDATFHAAFNALRAKGAPPFGKGDHCEAFVRHYKKLFGNPPDYSNVAIS